jgi:thymidylate synthase (FAD)
MTKVAVLDHGYIELIEAWGSDERVIESARMSTGKGFLGWGPKGLMCVHTGCDWEGTKEEAAQAGDEVFTSKCPKCGDTGLCSIQGDEKLLRYLYKNKHSTPFEFGGLVVEIQAPIFVFREWQRHRTQSYNEMSARYAPLPDLNYVPSVERVMLNEKTQNKQAGTVHGSRPMTEETAQTWRSLLQDAYSNDERLYQGALALGVPKELARIHLPVGRYSRMRAHANLRNWLAFLTLRMDKAAQWEIRQYAEAVHDLLRATFPRAVGLFDEGL